MANEEHLALLRQGVDAWNRWRESGLDSRLGLGNWADLRGADLRRANLCSANLHGADLRGADLSGAHLNQADLHEAALHGADLRGATLCGADLGHANLRKVVLSKASLDSADLRGADLREANLSGVGLYRAYLSNTNLSGACLVGTDLAVAHLDGADLDGAILDSTVLGDTDLSNTKGLGTCCHTGPSLVDHRTLQRSWPLALSFLRGIGLPDNLIEYLPSLLNQPIQFCSCFISYSSTDEGFARRLYADLQAKGVRCWFAPEDMKIHDRIRDAIDQAIRLRDKLLVVLSETSIASHWVEDEVETALEEERHSPDQRTVLFPVRIDDAVLQTDRAWARKLRRERHIGDFTRWKDHDAYRHSFERLLRNLKPELERRPGSTA